MFSRETLALMDAAVDAILIIDGGGNIVAANESTCRTFGYARDELPGRNVGALMADADRAAHAGYMRRHLETGRQRIIGVGREVIGKRKDGSHFPLHLSVGRIAGEPPTFVGILRDITQEHESRLARERLTRVAQLATLGEMAAGLAHELNQPLTAITTYARACERYLDLPTPDLSELREGVHEINAEGLRAGEIIRRLRQLVRQEPAERTLVDVNALVEELGSLLRADARAHDAALRLSTPGPLPRVDADPAQIQQLVLNLARNAFESVLEIAPGTRAVEIASARTVDGGVELRVTDNGPGISPEMSERLFEPFCTTKPSGTGLGLAMSRTIVQAHGGTIDAQPVEPRGACFRVRLPAGETARR